MDYWRRESLEMAGYQQGKTAKTRTSIYRHYSWTEEEEEAFNRGYTDGLKYNKTICLAPFADNPTKDSSV